MTAIEILHTSVATALGLKDQLAAEGLILDQDFEWAYHQAVYDNFSARAVVPRRTIFRFRDPMLATYYQLKWI